MKKKSGSALSEAMKQIEKTWGKGSVYEFGKLDLSGQNIDVISTGSYSLNNITGIGGIPRGRITEIFGPESGGKTTLALHAVAQCQRAGLRAGYLDVEHAVDIKYANALGVNMEDLIFSQPESAEMTMDIAEQLITTGELGLVVIDSVAAMVPKAEIDGEFGNLNVGLQARLMSQAMRKINGAVTASNTALVFINQIRDNIGGFTWGNKETTPGGRALKFFASLRLDIRSKGKIKDGNEKVGNQTLIRVAKNKLSSPFRECEFVIRFGEGIDNYMEIVDMCMAKGILKRDKGWITLGGRNVAQGVEKMRVVLKKNEKLMTRLSEKVLS